ncbi:MAG: hypothetical protein JWO30_3768 [Fibrobacteres bacterium]|nr:hypothetical protein [Fibrobacterota bacterium]
MDNLMPQHVIAEEEHLLKDNRLAIIPEVLKIEPLKGVILELCAGSCWFTAELSKIPAINEVYALDMSERALEQVAPRVFKSAGAMENKITRVIGDLYAFEFPQATFDYVVFDAGLHHIDTPKFSHVMKKIAYVLKPGGKLLGIREPFLTPIPFLSGYRRTNWGKYERSFGITENIYTKHEWRVLFTSAGFSPRFYRQATKTNTAKSLKEKVKLLVRNSALGFVFNFLFPPEQIIIAEKN